MPLIRFGTDVEGAYYDPDRMMESPNVNFRRYYEGGKKVVDVGRYAAGIIGTVTLAAIGWGLATGYFKSERKRH